MVNEVVPRDKLLQRAWTTRRPHHDPATNDAADDHPDRPPPMAPADHRHLDGGFAIQMFAHLAKKKGVHSRDHIGSVVDYVRKGKKNNFDLIDKRSIRTRVIRAYRGGYRT